MPASSKAKVSHASHLYEEFTGHEAGTVEHVKGHGFDVGLNVGKVDGIMYETVRDGVTERYIHKFKKSARPDLAASYDGSQLGLIGGKFTFTDAGIVDD